MAQKPSRPSLWQRWVDPKQLGTGTLLIIIGVIVTALIGTSFALVKSGTVEVFSGDGDPIIDEITGRDIWVTRPETFPSASERDSETAHLDRSRGGADLIVVTPDKLVRKAAEYDG